ncbi:oligosaccharide flippase family protein [Labrenzia sp. 011]|uniref:oligosaccharide flippase family protein n=1 Tax=Labrenzia sp. 011 TaxID=2171494 RepID=UPI000D50D9E0|nr:oligosaccharide flippase family protein [Labrenzia sp. 011]PVB60669.1 polysaccharide biosynthesis protein [Labrenzia sp. 011]
MLRQVSSYMTANVVSAVFGFALVMLFTRVLTPHEYGIYVVGIGIATLFSSLLFNWIKTSLLRFSSEGEEVDMRLTALAAFAGIVLISPFFFELFVFVSGESSSYAMEALLVAIGVGLFEFLQEIFRAHQKTGLFASSMIVRSAMAFVISCVLVIGFDLGGEGLLLGVAGGYFVTLVFFMPSILKRPMKGFDPEILKTMLRFGLPMTASGAAFTLHSFFDRILIVALMGEAAAGIYGASADFVRQIILMMGVAIGSAVVPIAIRLYARDGLEATDQHMRKSFEILMALILPATVGMALTSGRLATFVLGEDFRDAATVLIPILVFAWLFRTITYQYIHVSFQLAKKPFMMGVQGLFILALSVSGMLILVPIYGLVGAAASLVVSEICGVVFGYYLSRYAYRLPVVIWPVAKICLATGFMAIPTYLSLRIQLDNDFLNLIVPVFTGAVTYIGAVMLFDIVGLRAVFLNRFRAA